MKPIAIITTIISYLIGGLLMYYALKYSVTPTEIIILAFFVLCLLAMAAGSKSRADKAYDAMRNCKHEKFIGDVCSECGYCYSDTYPW